jgi:hypothetical protein
METNNTEKLENLRKLVASYFNTVNPSSDKTGLYTAKIELLDYYELGCVITNMLKMCVLAVDHDMHKISDAKNQLINVSLILEMVIEMFPLEEFELLSKINKMFVADSKNVNE